MKSPAFSHTHVVNRSSFVDYRRASLFDLASHVVESADRDALGELLSRTPFCYRGQTELTLVDLLQILKLDVLGLDQPYAESAFDLALDKFSKLQDEDLSTTRHIDCRRIYRAFCSYVQKLISRDVHPLERELIEAKALQGLVKRHFHFALLENRRKFHKSRYRWRSPRGDLVVYMPNHIIGKAREDWLRTHVPNPAPDRQGEAQRVQAIVDEAFFCKVDIELDEEETLNERKPGWINPFCVPGEDIMEFKIEDLATTVAQEKRAQIHLQRKPIRSLGPQRLEQLILSVFEDVASGTYRLSSIADEYGISLPTFSRFAGAFWNRPLAEVPDLWKNTAQVLGSHPLFREILSQLGVGEGKQVKPGG